MHMVDEENDEKVTCAHLDDPEYMSYKHSDEPPGHRLTELQGFSRNAFSRITRWKAKRWTWEIFPPEEAVEATKHAIDLCENHFAPTS